MLLRQTLLYLPAQIVGPLAQFVSVILWTHFLSPEDMGVFALIVAAQEFAYTLTLFWFSIYTMRYFERGGDGTAAYLDVERVVLIGAAAATIAGMAALPLFIGGEWSALLIAATLAYSALRTVATHLADRARAAHDQISYSLLQIVWPILGFLLALALVTAWEPATTAVLLGYAAGQAVALALAAPRLGFGVGWSVSRDIVTTAWRYGLPLVIGALFIWLANNGVRFLIEARDGAAAVGLVTVAWGLGLRVASFAAMLVTAAAFPVAMARSREGGIDAGQEQLQRNGILLLAVLAPAAAGLWAISGPLVDLIVAEPFKAMTTALLPWAILAGVARNLRIHCGEQVFLLREEPMTPLINDAIDAAVTLAGAAIGLVIHGLVGAVIGAAIGSIAALFVTIYYAAARHAFVLPLPDLAKIATATTAMTAVVMLLPVTATTMALVAAVMLGGATYAVALAGLYPDRAIDAFRRLRSLR